MQPPVHEIVGCCIDRLRAPGFELTIRFAHSDSYQWIAVSGSKATLRGTALVNQANGYSFQLEIRDGQLDGSGIDSFRLKVWQSVSGVTVYDNGRLTPLASGSIVLHK